MITHVLCLQTRHKWVNLLNKTNNSHTAKTAKSSLITALLITFFDPNKKNNTAVTDFVL